ncbi:MATE efflux family protein 5 [Acorus gramineus]|uniref:MATE efflux family protein 5 n=1 Tax=Acorus gramineus TaxID=55184 RepID=A0AAV9AUB8_ACOGR|nr:MATE efflux family protein 5 [Acorus gramineus]
MDAAVKMEDSSWRASIKEGKRLSLVAAPMIAISVSQFSLQVISTMMVGRLGELSLASATIASSITNVTGLSVLIGMASALETLCGQAYGAKQYEKLGLYTYKAIVCLNLVSLPLSLILASMEKLLTLAGQDPLISSNAGLYAAWMIPSLFAYSISQPLMRFLQAQSLTSPMFVSSVTALCLHIPLCWVLVFKSGLGIVGAALAIGVSNWVNAAFLAFLDWWSYEVLILLSGLLPNPKLETSVLSICLTSIALLYNIPYGLGAAASTRVSNELGAGNALRAQSAARVAMFLQFAWAIGVGAVLFSARGVVGRAYSRDEEVMDHVTDMVPLVS